MGLLNLTIAELLALLVPLTALVVALYFYQRIRRRQVVSTLKFWPRRALGVHRSRRRKLHQPLSLLLQLLALVFLLLAVADPYWGSRATPLRQHVLILETSAWMAARSGGATLMEQARERALAYLRAVPASEPVMLIRADGLATPATRFTTNRTELERAIREAQPGFTAINLASALDLSRNSLALAVGEAGAAERRRTAGEVAYVGAGRLLEDKDGVVPEGIRYLRWIEIEQNAADRGIRQLRAVADPKDLGRWNVAAEVYNYEASPIECRVAFSFGGRSIGSRTLTVAGRSAGEVRFSLKTEQGNFLRAALTPGDDFDLDNAASLRLPQPRRHAAQIFSERPERLRPLLEAVPRLAPAFLPSRQWPGADSRDALLMFDRFVPAQPPPGIYLYPPAAQSPLKVLKVAGRGRITHWVSSHPLAEGLHSQDVRFEDALIFAPEPGDEIVAESGAGPVIVARETNGGKSVFFGFDPASPALRNTLTAPLLLANTLRWLAPDVFRISEIRVVPSGLIDTEVPGVREDQMQISSSENMNLPWSLSQGRLRFFAGRPGRVLARSPLQQWEFDLTLPQVGAVAWEPPAGVLRGVPPAFQQPVVDGSRLWQWLALAGLLCWLVDWILFGRRRDEVQSAPVISGPVRSNRILTNFEDERAAKTDVREVVR